MRGLVNTLTKYMGDRRLNPPATQIAAGTSRQTATAAILKRGGFLKEKTHV